MHVVDVRLNERSRALSERVDALAAALRAAGVAPEVVSRVLESAATATLHALTLELLLDGPEPAGPAATGGVETPRAVPSLARAA